MSSLCIKTSKKAKTRSKSCVLSVGHASFPVSFLFIAFDLQRAQNLEQIIQKRHALKSKLNK